MTDTPTLPEQKNPPRVQMSAKAIQEVIRPHVPELIEKALHIARGDANASNQIAAIKLLLGKVIPDLKSTELTDTDGKPVSFRVVIDTQNKL